jgi:hypothetical protein
MPSQSTQAPNLTVAGPYPTASYPYGKPVACRTIWHVSTVARRATPGGLFPSLPVASWTITRYDDAPRKYHVRHESDNSTAHFTARSLRDALNRIGQS